MQNVKKYFTEGLIQFTILLSLIGVRVDVDSYLNGYFSPLLEINVGPSSAYIQTPFHNLRDTWDGYSVHPKCLELDYFFTSRRLLDEVRALGSPRFPTQLNAWLVHQVPDSSEFQEPSNNISNGADINSGLTLESALDNANHSDLLSEDESCLDRREECHTAIQEQCVSGPYIVTGACEAQDKADGSDEEAEEPAPVTQLVLSSTLEEHLLDDPQPPSTLSGSGDAPPTTLDWSHFLSTDFDDLDPLVPQRLSDLDTDISSAISQNVSLRDAMVRGTGPYDVVPHRDESGSVTQQRGPYFRLESTNSSHSDSSPGVTAGLATLPFSSVCNATRNVTSDSALGGCLDEAVFDQINLLGLEGLDSIDPQLLGSLEGIDPRVLEDLDSDSGLSLENSSRGPTSPGTSEVSSSSSSFCEDEGGATGYSSEADSLPSKGIADYDTWSQVDLSENVWHDHSYSSPPYFQSSVPTFSHKAIKEEPLSEEEYDRDDEQELSRDELRARAMCIPFSAPQIVSMPVEEFLELLEGQALSSAQITLLRDIRRRGKNKLAAQNCRKRKLDAITGLQEEVERLQAQRDTLLREKQHTAKALGATGQRIEQLSRDVLARLRDDLGQPLTPDRYSLQCGASGRLVVQPIRRPVVTTTTSSKSDKRKKEKKP
ncbi:nuclear factor erythroid 2-related factor 3 [Hypomesus transpacificus]|uniref:nuclear factor erythroid 2-related factor 3 n=1 Tax=Hypomesus transpacificus TaxID=137520 RepID=UPI001F07C205|nr:nuclear factor erythroid 2-related factor 3 [Hypomesus transpacificus]